MAAITFHYVHICLIRFFPLRKLKKTGKFGLRIGSFQILQASKQIQECRGIFVLRKSIGILQLAK